LEDNAHNELLPLSSRQSIVCVCNESDKEQSIWIDKWDIMEDAKQQYGEALSIPHPSQKRVDLTNTVAL